MSWRRKQWSIWHPFGVVTIYFIIRLYQVPHELYHLYDLMSGSGNDKCHIPKLDPYDPSIMQYISHPSPITCKSRQPDLMYIDDTGHLWLNATAATGAGYAIKDLRCRHRCVLHDTGVQDDTPKYGTWLDFDASSVKTKLECEFIEVQCSTAGRMSFQPIYAYHLAHIIPKPLPKSEAAKKGPRLSVFMFGIDSMSESNMIRQLPKTLEYFLNNMNGIVFHGHSKVGDNTWANLLATLTGKTVETTREFKPELNISTYDRFFDDWAEYVWKNFSRAGYETLFAEDRADIHLFNYPPERGFRYPPTDHYLRPFWSAVHWSSLHLRSSAFCYNKEPEYQLQLDWLEDFLRKSTANGRPYFAFNWLQGLSHDYLNAIGGSDDGTEAFLRRIHPLLNSTIFFLFSDHGNRYDSIRQSIVGRIEARMPFMGIALPNWMRERYPSMVKRMKMNGDRLTSQFDIYATFGDILNSAYADTTDPLDTFGHGHSLFRPIDPDRHCFAARIPEEYCPCYHESPMSLSDANVEKASLVIVSHINELLQVHIIRKKCAELSLKRIVDAHMFLPRQQMIHDSQVGKEHGPSSGFYIIYRLQIETKPNRALFESIVKHSLDDGSFWIDGDVDRNNAYGNTSACMNREKTLRKFCFCIG